MKLRFHHIGMATESIEDSIEAMSRVGECRILTDVVTDPLQSARLQMVRWNGIEIELIAGEGEKNPVRNLLKRGTRLYHVCFSTDNLEEATAALKSRGWLEVSGAKPAKLFGESQVAFMYCPALGIIELVENKE
jgi:methylmalonyl-CoA/ethylmalonyl-CoA epimerase